ncbi:Aste57867_7934 [Aphanomyces stellatus]|uniref:Aste57867_7934 protein n=1 Tax=Aphanomyces stellatus TaxID=120398 RepID=A0A485KJ18_9STRA|nr:hypothetical protein As57867_007904 [Aphanomyces stellatus]VFT84827.1 Aste57867_7934 [Aphanomyces stellatus]
MTISKTPETSIAADVLATAFLHYPPFDFAFEGENEEAQARKLRILFRCCVQAARLFGGIVQTEDKNGALLWLPGPKASLGLCDELRSGMGMLPFQLGFRQTWRLSQDGIMQYILQHANVERMGYIWLVGVDAKCQGKGYCRILMEQAMDEMKSQGMTECWLSTDTETNVKRYERLGFDVVHMKLGQSSGHTAWIMRKLT